MAVATLNSTALLFAASTEATYAAAREGGNGRYVSEFGWIGQYFGGGPFEVNQVFASFDLSGLPTNALITGAKLIVTARESYGNHTVEVRSSAFTPGAATSFVPGSGLAAKPLLGSTAFADGFDFERQISLSGFTRENLANLVLAGAAQRTGTAPTGDTTTRIDSARLEITWELAFPVVQATAQGVRAAGAAIALPSGVVAGDLILVLVSTGSASALPAPAGYTSIGASLDAGGSYSGHAAFYRTATGSDACAFAAAVGFLAYRISGAGVPTGAFASFFDPPAHTAPLANNLWFASVAEGSDTSDAVAPTGYGNLIRVNGSPGLSLGSARRSLAAASDNPVGEMNSNFGARVSTIVVPPAASGSSEPEPGDTTAPTITSPATASVAENVANPTGSLTANETVNWSIAGGADAALFSISGSTWTLGATPDFEAKASYAVTFRATDAAGNASTQAFTLAITDVAEGGGGVPAVTGWKTPGGLASIVDGNRSWAPVTPANLTSVDGTIVRATGINSTAITHVLRSFNFGFSDTDVPVGATITGVEVEIVRRRSFGSGVPFARHARLSIDSGVRTVAALGDQIGTNNSTDVEWTNSFTTAPYGGLTDLWGAALTPALIKQTAFGFDYGLQGGAASMDAAVDQLRMRVHFTTPGTPSPTRRAPRSFFWF